MGSPWSGGWRIPGGGTPGGRVFKSRVPGAESPCLHKPGHCGCRRPASGRGPGGSCGVRPSSGIGWRVPPQESRGVALCPHPAGRKKLRGLQDDRAPWTVAFLPLASFARRWEAHPLSLSPAPLLPMSQGPHQAAAVAVGLQRAVCGHEDGVGSGRLNLGHQIVVLGTGGWGHGCV